MSNTELDYYYNITRSEKTDKPFFMFSAYAVFLLLLLLSVSERDNFGGLALPLISSYNQPRILQV